MTGNQAGDWRELCKEVSREYDPEKLLDLMRQINRALSQQRAKLMESHSNPVLGQFGGALTKSS
jgi:hypothetical protein